MSERRNRLIARMDALGIESALITMPENIRYLSGYTGEGALFLSKEQAVVVTDFRYTEQAARQAPDCAVARTTAEEKLPAVVARLMAQAGVLMLGLEMGNMTVVSYRALEAALPGVALEDLQELPEALRMVKEQCELDCIVRASEIACAAFDAILREIRPGMSERDVQVELDYHMLRGGSEALAFQTIACAGKNSSLPHATPSDYKLCTGDLLTLDFGAQVGGYKTDMTRTVAVGNISSELRAIYDTVYEAQKRALEAVKPGVVCMDVDLVARRYIDARYPGAFGHSLGHGVGLCIHESPNFSTRCVTVLESGHVMTVEPGVYIEGLGGCRIEDTVILRPDGYVNLITAPKELIVL